MGMLTERKMDTKVCGNCREVKLLSDFYKKKASKDGYQPKCKACIKEYEAKSYAANPEKKKNYSAEYRAANPEKIKDYKDEYHAANPKKRKEKDAKYYAANSEKLKEYQVEYYAANTEKRKEYGAEYRAANPEKLKEYNAEYQKANPEKYRAKNSNRRAVKLEAIPSWLTEEDWQAMEDIGKEAKRLEAETGIKMHVDHIHPLQPPKVVMFEGEMIPLICAFHCPQNLQILTAAENCSKGNKFTPYVESEI